MGSGWLLLILIVSLGAVGAGASFACSVGIRWATGLKRRSSLVLGWASWVVIATCTAWILLEQDVAEAIRLGKNSIALPVAYFLGWLISTFVGPLLGYVSSAAWRAFHGE